MQFFNSTKFPYVIIAILAASILMGDLMKPVHVATVTSTALHGVTCVADGRSWPARADGMCAMADKPN